MNDIDWYSQFEGDMAPEDLQQRAEELEDIPNAQPDENGFIELPVLPLRDVIVYPHMVAPLSIGRSATLTAIEEALSTQQVMIAVPQRDPRRETPRPQDFLPVGVEIAVSDIFPTGVDSSDTILTQGRRRVVIEDYNTRGPVMYARARIVEDPTRPDLPEDALMRHVMRVFEQYIELNESFPEEVIDYLANIEEPGWLADMLVNSFPVRLEDRQAILTTTDVGDRLRKVMRLLSKEIEVLQLEEELQSKTQNEMNRGDRETYLRERMKVIQQELGEGDPWSRELRDLHTRIKKAELPTHAEEAAVKEFERLYQMPPMSPEVGVIRSYIDWIIDLPWENPTEDNLDVKHAEEVLNRNHFGLDKAKDRILEYIAVKSLKPKGSRQPVLCFIGPPGTGKTTLGRSIAEALGREFVRLSLGGVRDEAEMRGHRRTYIGALPGRIIQTMKRGGTTNPVFILDEIDKLGVGFRGDPAAALLEVLDPEQNHEFSDHYLEIGYDLSEVMFITTANDRSDIPWALYDRMEVVEFPGYIEEEKIEIAKQFIISRQTEESGLEENELEFSDPALQKIIRSYTYEAGVRNLEREVGRVCRKVARLKAEEKKYPARITPAVVEKLLGPPEYSETEAEREDEVGVATAVAWTAGGGDIMPIEVVLLEGKGNLQLTGQLGEVMQESAQAALSYMKSRAKQLKLSSEDFEDIDIHIHIPEGAVPKDGPSAGITMATAMISAFTNKKVRKDLGMTGEITLRGRVLQVGGVREKILAAHRAGLKTVLIPEKNKKDLVDLPKKAKADMEIIPVSHMDEVLDLAFVKAPKKKKAAKVSDTAAKDSGSGAQAGA